jgi:hypothetical protein
MYQIVVAGQIADESPNLSTALFIAAYTSARNQLAASVWRDTGCSSEFVAEVRT